MDKAATIYDVAETAGVSIATVSRVINNPGMVSGVTREKVAEAMATLNFVPKAEAVARARKGHRRVGVLTPFFTEPSFVQRLRGVASALASIDHDLITYSVDSVEHYRAYLLSLTMNRRVDGLIIFSLPLDDTDIQRLVESRMPVVLVEGGDPRLSGVTIDNVEGGRMVARYLLKKGYKRPAFLGEGGQPAYSLHATDMRLRGFTEGCESQGIALADDHLAFHPYGMAYAMKVALGLLSLNPRPDVVFASSDLQAVAVMRAARELGLHVPRDLGVIGFDDIDLADYMGITTVKQGLDESGSVAVNLLMEQIRDADAEPRTINLDLEIVERDTT